MDRDAETTTTTVGDGAAAAAVMAAADGPPVPEMTVAVYAAPSEILAEMVRGALEAEGIAAVIGEQVTDAYAGAFALAEGFWGEVRVPASDEDRARAVLEAFEQGRGAASDAELTAQAESASDPQV